MCDHMNFRGGFEVTRLTDDDIVTGYNAEIEIKCMDCDSPFYFVGVSGGFSPNKPMRNFDGTKLRAPIMPGIDLHPDLIPNKA